MLCVRLLGQFEVRREEEPVDISSRTAQSLFAYLILNPGIQHRREKLAGLLWPDSSETSARKNLRHNLWVLRDRLGRDLFEADRIHISLTKGRDIWLDVTVLQGDVHEAGPADDLLPIVDVYHGDLLPGFYDEWIVREREHLRLAYEQQVRLLLTRLEAEERWSELLNSAGHWLALDETAEPAYQAMLRAYQALGDSASAATIYQRCVSALQKELGVDPAPETQALYSQITQGQTSGFQSPAYRLPAATHPLIGREEDLGTVGRLMNEPDCRLLTIIGPGGIGKTSLAIEAARSKLDRFPDGVCLVELAKLHNPANIPSAIAEATGYLFSSHPSPKEQILSFLSNKHMLLVLDNVEHLLAGVDLVTELLNKAPEIILLLTSRQRLNLSSETIFVLAPFEVPGHRDVQKASASPAVQLFVHSARRARPDFALSKDNLADVVRICDQVGGVPLGILLAAAWVDIVSPAQIADEISRDLDFLAADLRDLPERQRSMRAALDHSWKLLSEQERTAFARLSVFRGGCTIQAAQTVSGASLRTLSALVNKSLLWRDVDADRFTLHELLRQYGEEHLERSVTLASIRAAHMRYYLSALADRRSDLKGDNQSGGLDAIEADFENIRSAWEWALEKQHFDLLGEAAESLMLFCRMRSRFGDGEDLLGAARDKLAALSKDTDQNLWAWLVTRCEIIYPQGRPLGALVDDFMQALAIAQQTGDAKQEAFTYYALGWAHISIQDYSAAINYLEHSLAIYESLDEPFYQAEVLHYLDYCHSRIGDSSSSKDYLIQAAERRRRIGDRYGLSTSLLNLGVRAAQSGDWLAADAYYRETIAIMKSMHDLTGQAVAQSNLAVLYVEHHRRQEARLLVQEAQAIARRFNHPHTLSFTLLSAAYLALAEEAYELAEDLCQQQLSLPLTDRQFTVQAHYILAWAAVGLGNYRVAEQRLKDLVKVDILRSYKADAIQVKAFLLAHENDGMRATELLALYCADTHTELSQYKAAYPLIGQLVVNLKSVLGEHDFSAACERGKELEMDATYRHELADAQ